MESTITRDGYVFLRTEGNTATPLSIQRTDSDMTNPLAQIKMFGPDVDDLQGGLSFETINIGSPDRPTEERMRIHTNGNVGIGATTPSEKLEVDGAVKATEFVGDGSKLTGISESKWSDAPGGDIYYGKGNVGIGTPTPKNRLDVEGGAVIGATYSGTRTAPTNGLLVQGNVGIGTPDEPKAKLEVFGGAIMPAAGKSESAGILFPKDPGGGGGDAAWIRYYPRSGEATTFEIGTSNDKNDHIALMPSGNVGIGTPDPDTKLHITGGSDAKLGSGSGFLVIGSIDGENLVMDNNEIMARKNGEKSPLYLQSNGGDVVVHFWEKESKFIIKDSGNVGIGTADPDAKLDVDGFIRSLGISVNNAANTGVGRGLWLWSPSDSNHVIYSANPKGKSPANKTAAKGYFDAGHRLRLRTATGQGFLFENNKETALVDIDSDNGRLWTKGAIYSGNSDLYFTKTDHDHTGIGNSKGYAAIENAKNYDALMILGRAGTSKGRYVRLWDYLQVNGDMDITGRLGTSGFSPKPRTSGWGGGIHTWDVEAEGTMWSRHGYQSGKRDLAENYLSDKELEPGDVVCLDKDTDRIVLTDKPNDILVLGVISTEPGFLLDVEHDIEKENVFPVALCGRVPCKVVDENGPIKRGDLLTSSPTLGHAMKAKPLKMGEQEFFSPGTIIGKALGSLESGKGVIDTFVFLM